MDCIQTERLPNKEYLKQFNRKVIERRIPLSGSLDLTHRCNLHCIHCYLGEKRTGQAIHEQELNSDQWMALIDQFVEAGCLFLLITGGEPLLRKDFVDIYSHAKTSGLIVTLFTNGTLVTDEIADLLEGLPPQGVEITLYGATPATYEKITGKAGSYQKCIQGIRKLVNRKIELAIKTVLMTANCHEFHDIENMAKDYGVKFRCDPAVSPGLDGDKKPLRLRISPEEAVQKEFSDPGRAKRWRAYFERMKGLPVSDALYDCGAGLMSFHVDPYGNLQPCLMVHHLKYDLRNGDFRKGWSDVISGISQKKASAFYPCHHCQKRTLCGSCPAFFRMENGGEEILSEYLCAIGQYRFQQIEMRYEGNNANETG